MRLIITIFLTLYALPTSAPIKNEFVVWNIGQGLWTTEITESTCLHFDSGGSNVHLIHLKQTIKQLCANKENQFQFSHWDYDHISFFSKLALWLPKTCVANPPGGSTKSLTKKNMIYAALKCVKPNTEKFLEFSNNINYDSTNAASRVFQLKNFLLPGDSPIPMEKIWIHKLLIQKVTTLILGHHGSRTSTGNMLLKNLIALKTAVASSESHRYGHPHIEVRKNLKKYGVSLIETQVWGNIHFTY